jgi:NADH:ubiquinone oxidoreductase subunit D
MFDKSCLRTLVYLKNKISRYSSPSEIRNNLKKQLLEELVVTNREIKNLARNSAILQQRLEGIGPYQTESANVWDARVEIFYDSYIDFRKSYNSGYYFK